MVTHEVTKSVIFSRVIEMIAIDEHITLDEARDEFYNSYLVTRFSDDSLGLYGQSPLFIYSLYKEEKKRNSLN